MNTHRKRTLILVTMLLLLANGLTNPFLTPAEPGLHLYLPIIVRAENVLGNWDIQTDRGESHSVTFDSSGSFSIIFDGETNSIYGTYTLSDGNLSASIKMGVEELRITAVVSGTTMSGTWQGLINGVIVDSGDFSGIKL